MARQSDIVRLTRRGVIRTLGLGSLGLIGGSLLAACGGGAPAAGPTTAPAQQGSSPTATAAPAQQATAPTPTTASQSQSAPAAQGNAPSGKKGEVSWLVRTGTVENKWEKDVAIPQFEKANAGIKINLIV